MSVISAGSRRRIYKRDGWRCVYCGEQRRDLLTVDHVVPVSHGGTARQGNLVTCCLGCNQQKGDQGWDWVPPAPTLAWGRFAFRFRPLPKIEGQTINQNAAEGSSDTMLGRGKRPSPSVPRGESGLSDSLGAVT